MFNCGEGTQRLANEHKNKLARLDHIFMTRSSWESTGGLLEVCLQIKDSVSPNVTLHGPDGLVRHFFPYYRSHDEHDVTSGRHFSCNETLCYSE